MYEHDLHAAGSRRMIRVGLVGADPTRGWTGASHIPALRALSNYQIVAVSNRSLASSTQAAAAFGIPRAYASVSAMLQARDIDLVVISVRLPHHRQLVLQAIDAGKMIYCEWPLGGSLDEAEEMNKCAQQRGTKAIVGLQGRMSSVVNHAKKLIDQGFIGNVLSTSVIGSGYQWGATTQHANAYLADGRNGATMLSVAGGHMLDTLSHVLGEVVEVSAQMSNSRREVRIEETGEAVALTCHDQVVVAAKLGCGAAMSLHYRGGTCRGTNFLWEINGSDGDLVIRAAIGHPQFARLQLEGVSRHGHSLAAIAIPSDEFDQLDPRAANVARLYNAFSDALDGNPRNDLPDFAVAVKRQHLLDAISLSAEKGVRIALSR